MNQRALGTIGARRYGRPQFAGGRRNGTGRGGSGSSGG